MNLYVFKSGLVFSLIGTLNSAKYQTLKIQDHSITYG